MRRTAATIAFSSLLAACLAGALCGCSRAGQSEETAGNPAKTVMPRSAEEEMGEQAEGRNPAIQGYGVELSANVPLDEQEILLQMYNVNMDLDKNDEQILAIKQKGDPTNPIAIVVVDYDEIRAAFTRSWEGPTQATNQRAFDIELIDVIGDYNMEVVCRGVNADGETTLDIFRKTISPSGTGLYFSSICSLASDRPIIIESEKRDQAYREREKTGQAFPIIVERRDPESDNDLDVIKETWAWKYQEKKYIKILSEKIPGDKMLQERLRGLFAGDTREEDFRQFLSGSWHKTNVVDNIIFFDPTYDSISFYNGTVLEVYTVEEIQTARGYTFLLYLANDTLANVKRSMLVDIRDMDSIRITSSQKSTIQDGDEWQGSYVRLSPDLQESLLQKNRWAVGSSEAALFGIYRSADGPEIAFEPPYFTWIDAGGNARSGGFTMLSNVPLLNGHYLDREITDDVQIITFRFMSAGGVRVEDEVYVIEYSENQEPGAVRRTILLTPAVVSVRGALLTSKETRALEQLEFTGGS